MEKMEKKENNVFCFQKISDSLVLQQKSPPSESKIKLIDSKVKNETNVFTFQQECFKSFDKYFETFETDLYSMKLTTKNMDQILSMLQVFMKNFQTLHETLFDSYGKNAISVGTKFISKKLCDRDSHYKRNKLLEQKTSFVKPVEKPVGLKWKSNIDPSKSIVDHTLTQSKYSYVSIIDTIKSLFSDPGFEKLYTEYNLNQKHSCVEGVYRDFCCGSISKKYTVFESPLSIQIQLAIDEFDPCDALKTKAGNQKTCAVYFEIRNIPPEFRSKLDARFLVALIKSTDLKQRDDGYDLIANQITNEMELLQKRGVNIDSKLNIKGGLVNISYDNLGGNGLLGFVECFVANYYCRICEMSRQECQKSVCENTSKLRTKTEYEESLNFIKENDSEDYKTTKGLKRHCVFNKLDHFHILDNLSADIVHDILEGVAPFFVRLFFESLIKNNILSLSQIWGKVRDYNYGFSNKNYKPSKIKLEKSNLNQNAKQMHCLMLHLPFIFNDQKEKLPREWSAMTDLLQIMQIVFSNCITESDLKRLQKLIHSHLSIIVELGLTLHPKHHMLTHYPTIIKRMGPLVLMWMMRAESKHRVFTDIADNTYNFVNLPKTMADKHQTRLAFKHDIFSSKIVASTVSFNVKKTVNYSKYEKYFNDCFSNGYHALKFFKINSYDYRPGFFVLIDKKPFEIQYLFQNDQTFKVLCHPFINLEFNKSLNSIEIIKEESFENCLILEVSGIKNVKTYEKTMCKNDLFIIADTLDVF